MVTDSKVSCKPNSPRRVIGVLKALQGTLRKDLDSVWNPDQRGSLLPEFQSQLLPCLYIMSLKFVHRVIGFKIRSYGCRPVEPFSNGKTTTVTFANQFVLFWTQHWFVNPGFYRHTSSIEPIRTPDPRALFKLKDDNCDIHWPICLISDSELTFGSRILSSYVINRADSNSRPLDLTT